MPAGFGEGIESHPLDMLYQLGFNVTILIESGEENGSPGLHAFCREQRSPETVKYRALRESHS